MERTSSLERTRLNQPSFLVGLLAAVCLLAGCEGEVSVDLTTEPAADATLAQVVVNIAGLQFRKNDGGTESLEYRTSEPVDLLEFANGDLLTLFTDEELPEGVYTGVRLLFDADADLHYVMDDGGRQLPLLLEEGDYAGIDFTVEEDESSRESFTLTLDIRQSLSFDDDNDEYSLRPVLRSVPSDEAGIIAGAVDVDCPSGTSLLEGGAVYLFQGDVVPDDRDGIGIEPYATSSLDANLATGEFTYAILDLPEGSYTLAATCRGDEEDPTRDDTLEFAGRRTASLDAEEVLTVDLIE